MKMASWAVTNAPAWGSAAESAEWEDEHRYDHDEHDPPEEDESHADQR